uniref:Cdc6 C-terminal domain-containing protein n=1 Tax=Kalanchoe fedtschenkoi TaxID=63787 RepID=A0A7N0U3E2_KALFE
MPAIAGPAASRESSGGDELGVNEVRRSDEGGGGRCTRSGTLKRRSSAGSPISPPSPMKWKSPRRCVDSSPRTPLVEDMGCADEIVGVHQLTVKRKLMDSFSAAPCWNPRKDASQMSVVKEVLHVSKVPSAVVCREIEQNRILEFCKSCVEQEKAGSLYACGCPGTGKSLSVEKVKLLLFEWAREAGHTMPDVLSITCTSLGNTSDIFSKMLGSHQMQKKTKGPMTSLQLLQSLYSHKQQSSDAKMMLVIADEMDYLITKDRAVLHDLFMLTTLPHSRCILIGIANAIDLADRFLPRLLSLNCKPMVISFRAYSKDQILRIVQERLSALPYTVFHPQALELCARKVAAASGDMRKALCICRSAIEILGTELAELSTTNATAPLAENHSLNQMAASAWDLSGKENDIVRIDHMAAALSKTFKSPVVDTIQSLPHHQQIILCSAVKLFRRGKKDTTIGELNKSYNEVCKSSNVPPVGIFELSSMCRVLSDQGLLNIGQSKEDRLRRVTLKVDQSDITFSLQGVRFFRNCLL